jgi:hypothetical protein
VYAQGKQPREEDRQTPTFPALANLWNRLLDRVVVFLGVYVEEAVAAWSRSTGGRTGRAKYHSHEDEDATMLQQTELLTPSSFRKNRLPRGPTTGESFAAHALPSVCFPNTVRLSRGSPRRWRPLTEKECMVSTIVCQVLKYVTKMCWRKVWFLEMWCVQTPQNVCGEPRCVLVRSYTNIAR